MAHLYATSLDLFTHGFLFTNGLLFTYYEPYGHDRNAMWNAINDTGMTSCVLSCCDTQWRARCVHIIPVVCYARPTDYFFLHITHSRCANRSNSL